MRAVAQDREAAAMMGIDVNRTISVTFMLAGGLAGGGGPRLPAPVQHALRHGLRARPDRVHRGGARRDRQPHRRRARRAHHRLHPGLQRGAHLARAGKRLDALDRLRDPDRSSSCSGRRACSASGRRRAHEHVPDRTGEVRSGGTRPDAAAILLGLVVLAVVYPEHRRLAAGPPAHRRLHPERWTRWS